MQLPPFPTYLSDMPLSADVTVLLAQADQGDAAACDRLFGLVYDELRRMAHNHLQHEHRSHTLRTTALVHEAYVKLADTPGLPSKSRAYFFGAAARAMRQILVDYARKRGAKKRGGDVEKVSLDAEEIAIATCASQLIELDDALNRLAAFDARAAQVVEYRFFGGLTVEQTAEALGLSERTIKRTWRSARSWLYTQLHPAQAS